MTLTLDALQSARNYNDLAKIFGVPASQLAASLYGPLDNYQRFNIPKRSGGHRIIEAPLGVRRHVQDSLAPLFSEMYKPSEHAHGFVNGRSIVSNAEKHVARKTVLNIDLQDFFHSITFQRVRGILLAQPFALNWNIANILAQACCCDGRLPAGGITSPVLSNIAASKLDKRLALFCVRHGGTYTRYVDDITLSFERSFGHLPNIAAYDPLGKLAISPKILEIIASEGFTPNQNKVHVAQGSSRKIVTGIVVNRKSNVRRKWLDALESTVYAMSKFGTAHVAASEFPNWPPPVAARMLLRRVHGRLAFLYMVRGAGDWITADLAAKFNRCVGNSELRIPDTEIVSAEHRVARALFVVHATDTENNPGDGLQDPQGTAFVRADGVLVTAGHVVSREQHHRFRHVIVRRHRAPMTAIRCEILHVDLHRDVAFLRPVVHDHDLLRHRLNIGSFPAVGQRVVSWGFPHYFTGHEVSRQEHEVTAIRPVSGVVKCIVTGNIVGGLSGAPVLNSELEVAAVVHRRSREEGRDNEFIGANEILGAYPIR